MLPYNSAAPTSREYSYIIDRINTLVAELNILLGLSPAGFSNRVSLGYIGNLESWGDDRSWHVFVPRSVSPRDNDMIGSFATGDEAGARGCYAALAARIDGVKMAQAAAAR